RHGAEYLAGRQPCRGDVGSLGYAEGAHPIAASIGCFGHQNAACRFAGSFGGEFLGGRRRDVAGEPADDDQDVHSEFPVAPSYRYGRDHPLGGEPAEPWEPRIRTSKVVVASSMRACW